MRFYTQSFVITICGYIWFILFKHPRMNDFRSFTSKKMAKKKDSSFIASFYRYDVYLRLLILEKFKYRSVWKHYIHGTKDTENLLIKWE
jgi:hypothetical protein